MSVSQILTLNDSPLLPDPVKYCQTVGALQYVTLSRPDITFVVNKASQFMHATTENHWATIKRIMRYLKGTSEYGLFIRHDSGSTLHAFTDAHLPTSFLAYSDADWVGCPDDLRSMGSSLHIWDAILSRGPPAHKVRSPVPLLNQNIKLFQIR
ncbi:putative mitochondrial protein AtMg00240 [Bidens hawaiensis]|uniref:putative mitochondrial protein AtMg00240 n=1 Tax=Bidens hawaiensis TaxID=980011 RepID=UPI0040498204